MRRVDHLDLDAMLGQGTTFTLGGRTYRLPAEVPLEVMMRAVALSDREQEARETGSAQKLEETLGQMREVIHDLLVAGGSLDTEKATLQPEMVDVLAQLPRGSKVELPDGTTVTVLDEELQATRTIFPQLGAASITAVMAYAMTGEAPDLGFPGATEIVADALQAGAGGDSENPPTAGAPASAVPPADPEVEGTPV